jgi:3-deoxy-D-manno-octulosonic-acid transferase
VRLAYGAYRALGWAALLLGSPALLARALCDPRYRIGWRERLGAWGVLRAPAARGRIWIHGASVGEIHAVSSLVAALRVKEADLLITSTSGSGRLAAGALAGPAGVARMLPLDLPLFVRRALRAARPQALVTVETELWPALLLEANALRVPCLLVNGRLSDRSFPRYEKVRRWLPALLDSFGAIQAQSTLDAERFLALGAPKHKVSVGGNLKFDLPSPDPADPDVRALRRARAGGWRILVGGSTHPGEEEALLAGIRILESHGLRTGLVLAPRHLERLPEVGAAIHSAGRAARRWSELSEPLEASILEAFSEGEVLLLDRYGLLSRLYGAAEAAFVGGSLVPVGGHNLLEPLNWGVPVLFGPFTQNARDVRDAVLRAGAGEEVRGAEELAAAVERYFGNPELTSSLRRGAEGLFERNRGAVSRAVGALEKMGALAGRNRPGP